MKKYIAIFMVMLMAVLTIPVARVDAAVYQPTAVTSAQLSTALESLKNYVATNETWQNVLSSKTLYWTIYYNSEYYTIHMDTQKPVLLAPNSDGNLLDTPVIKVYPQTTGNYNAYMNINADGSYTLPDSYYTGTSGTHAFYTNSTEFITYTSYDITNYTTNTWLRSAVSLGSNYRPTPNTISGPTYAYDSTVPTPTNLRVKLILPSGLFPKINETQVQTTWTSISGSGRDVYYLEISLLYNYKSGDDKITKLLPYVTYSNGVSASVGTRTDLMNTDLETFIHSKNTATSGQTFANGKLNLTHYYVRYATASDDKLKYGNWVKVDLVTGKSEIDKGNVVSQYDEVYTDSDGNEVEVTDSEYGGVQIDSNGNEIDPTSLTTFTDYLLAIPNILSATFTSLLSLVNGMGNFGQIFNALFLGVPGDIISILEAGLGLLIIVGIIKFLK